MKQIYIECAGMRIPYNWTPRHLELALMLRNIKLDNEAEIREIFGQYLDMIRDLNNQIATKRRELYLLPAEKTVSETLYKPAPVIPMPTDRSHKANRDIFTH
jgi:hypothetical protein